MTPEQRAARIHHHMYETCEGIAEHAERIVKLEELVRDMYAVMVEDAANCDVTYPEQFDDRMRELGMELDG